MQVTGRFGYHWQSAASTAPRINLIRNTGATVMDFLKVSSKSSPASVAGAIAGMVKDGVPVNLQAVGAGAVNQAVKAVAIARGFLIPSGFDISIAPTFSDIQIDGDSRTAIRIAVYVHPLAVGDAAASPAPGLKRSQELGA